VTHAVALTWAPPPANLSIDARLIHVWRADLRAAAERPGELESLLTPDEAGRAGRFHFPVHRARFVARRGILRCLLGRYLDVAPGDVSVQPTPYGKLELARRHDTGLRFNLSSSGDLALFAFARGREVGVDLERIRPELADEAIPEHFFAPSEVATLRALPRDRQPAAFFDCWVRKEAYIKARGLGLSLALDSFAVSFGDDAPPRLLSTAPDPEDAGRWGMVALEAGPECAAALVAEGRQFTMRCWGYPDRGAIG
jgi:4'-phosphopantetheinyl transferase